MNKISIASNDPTKIIVEISLDKLFEFIVGDNEFVLVDREVADAFYTATKNQFLCYVQYPADNSVTITGAPIIKPRLWRLNFWSFSAERTLKGRIQREEYERDEAIMRHNISLVVKALRELSGVEGDPARAMAYNIVRRGNTKMIAVLGVKLITNINDIPV